MKKTAFVTRAEAKDFGFGQTYWYRLIKTGQIPTIRCGRKRIVPREAFLAWYNSAAGQVDLSGDDSRA